MSFLLEPVGEEETTKQDLKTRVREMWMSLGPVSIEYDEYDLMQCLKKCNVSPQADLKELKVEELNCSDEETKLWALKVIKEIVEIFIQEKSSIIIGRVLNLLPIEKMVLCGLFKKKENHAKQVSVKKASSSASIDNNSNTKKSNSILDREPITTQMMTLVMIKFANIHEIPEDFVEYITSKIFEKMIKIGEEDEGQVTISSIPQLYCQIMYKHQRMNNIMKNALKIKAEIEAISFLSERQGEGVPRIQFKISISSGKNSCGNIGIPNVSTSIFGPVSVRGIQLLDLASIFDMGLLCDFNSMIALYHESNAFLDNFLYTVVHRFQFSKGDIQCVFQILSETNVSQLDQWRYGSNEERNQYINFLSEINLFFREMLSEKSNENPIDTSEFSNISKILTKGKTPTSSTRSLVELQDYQLTGEPLPWKHKLLQTFSENSQSKPFLSVNHNCQ